MSPPSVPAAAGGPPGRPRSGWARAFWGVTRWLHIYLSLFGFATILFFSVTGITLNHPTWFGGVGETTEPFNGTVDTAWLGVEGEREPDWLRLAEYIRATHQLQGMVGDVRDDGAELSLAFEGPAYAADVLVQREGGQYEGTITRHGMVALINDLHKGRDTGIPWSVVIDLSAVLMAVSAITGLVLLYSIKRKRVAGTLTALAGTLVLWLAYRWLVP